MLDDAWPTGARLMGFAWDRTRPYIMAVVMRPPRHGRSFDYHCGVWEARYPMAREAVGLDPDLAMSHLCIDAFPLESPPDRAALQVTEEGIEVQLLDLGANQVSRHWLPLPSAHVPSGPGSANYRSWRPEHPLRQPGYSNAFWLD